MFEVEFYADRNGEESVKDFIRSEQASGRTNKYARIRAEKILTYIRVLREYGTRAGMPYMKHIEDDIWELRPQSDRVFFFYFQKGCFVLLHHFEKKTMKTPRREIETARRNMRDYIERSKNHGK